MKALEDKKEEFPELHNAITKYKETQTTLSKTIPPENQFSNADPENTDADDILLKAYLNQSSPSYRQKAFGFIRALFTVVDKFIGALLGAVLGVISALFIHNPITCLLGSLYGREWKRFGWKNIFRVLASPLLFPIIGVLDALKDGAKTGYKQGLAGAIRLPVKSWKNARYTTLEILAPWLFMGIIFAGFGVVIGLHALGLIAFPGGATTAGSYMTAGLLNMAQQLPALGSLFIGCYGLWHFSIAKLAPEVLSNRDNCFHTYVIKNEGEDSSRQSQIANSKIPVIENKLSSHERYTPDQVTPSPLGRWWNLPADLSLRNSTEVETYNSGRLFMPKSIF